MLIELHGFYTYTLESEGSGFHAELIREQLDDHVELVHIRIEAEQAAVPPVFRLGWSLPVVDTCAMWHPASIPNRGLRADGAEPLEATFTHSAPVASLFSALGHNRLTFAFSDLLNAVRYNAGVNEETSTFRCLITMFETGSAPLSGYTATLRIDKREAPYYDCLQDVSRWWSSFPAYKPAVVPPAATAPMYSTRYSFHQRLTPEDIERQCRTARSLGCGAVIVDDGWQAPDNAQGYAYSGDWQVSEDKIPDMKAHVDRVHAMGMKYILRYSVPYVGEHSIAWQQYRSKLLYKDDHLGAGVLDPRYPEVRGYLLNLYLRALEEWDVDGFKLDFVDKFQQPRSENPDNDGERDDLSVAQATDLLLSQIVARLSELKPDIMIEFRQASISPLMRKYGNLLQAADCPNDAVQNRLRTLDIRLLSDETAAHSDLITWNAAEETEIAALQLINVLFAVPQISVRLDTLPREHLQMMSFWLDFWNKHKNTLLKGKLEPRSPEQIYPLVLARDDETIIAAAYCDCIVKLEGTVPKRAFLVNGTHSDTLFAEWKQPTGARRVEVRNCLGHVIREYEISGAPGLYTLPVPVAGVVMLESF